MEHLPHAALGRYRFKKTPLPTLPNPRVDAPVGARKAAPVHCPRKRPLPPNLSEVVRPCLLLGIWNATQVSAHFIHSHFHVFPSSPVFFLDDSADGCGLCGPAPFFGDNSCCIFLLFFLLAIVVWVGVGVIFRVRLLCRKIPGCGGCLQ